MHGCAVAAPKLCHGYAPAGYWAIPKMTVRLTDNRPVSTSATFPMRAYSNAIPIAIRQHPERNITTVRGDQLRSRWGDMRRQLANHPNTSFWIYLLLYGICSRCDQHDHFARCRLSPYPPLSPSRDRFKSGFPTATWISGAADSSVWAIGTPEQRPLGPSGRVPDLRNGNGMACAAHGRARMARLRDILTVFPLFASGCSFDGPDASASRSCPPLRCARFRWS